LVSSLDARAQSVLRQIPSLGRRLLAIRYYMIRRSELDSLWTWTTEQVRRFRRTEEYREIMSAIDDVRDTFAVMNPGYTIRVDVGHRSLARQIQNWNSVRSVRHASDTLLRYCRAVVGDTVLPSIPDERSQHQFDSLFVNAPDPIEPTVALPGYSQHGQLRAFDMRIATSQGRLIAGASSRAIQTDWEAKGWTARLRTAVELAGQGRLDGPLEKPYEPWHYTWVGSVPP